MFKKNVFSHKIETYKYQLVICQYPCDGYEAMKYYIAVHLFDAPSRDQIRGYGTNGYFVQDGKGKWDFFDMEDFNRFFIIAENCDCDKKISNILYWLRTVRKIKIEIMPSIVEDGFWYQYKYNISYPFNVYDEYHTGLDNFALAAKEAINTARKTCMKAHSKDGVGKWLEYIIRKDGRNNNK